MGNHQPPVTGGTLEIDLLVDPDREASSCCPPPTARATATHDVRLYRLPEGGLVIAEEHTWTAVESQQALCALAGRSLPAGLLWLSTTEGD
ncbi:hypothetical protein [Kitasatospora sp. NPDC005751]|uniref:hypothetical protein n=1 Tax=Kitasatospora sp. NPDC005751 TaxID=3157064 RepID=UPI0033E9CDC3